MKDIVIVGSVADNPVAEDIAHFMGQQDDYQDLISLKSFFKFRILSKVYNNYQETW